MDEAEVAVVGGGVAGLTAALFSCRLGRETTLFESELVGGRLLNVSKVEGIPGVPAGVAGYELCPTLEEEVRGEGVRIRIARVRGVEATGGGFVLTADDRALAARAVIVATGARFRRIGAPGEKRLTGKGISNCASCDGPLFAGTTVGVVGGGDSAFQEALELAEYASKVIVFHRSEHPVAQESYRRRVRANSAIEVYGGVEVAEVLGESSLSGVRLRRAGGGDAGTIELRSLFAYVGLEPESEFLEGLVQLGPRGAVVVGADRETSVPGLFAAGAVERPAGVQAVSAMGDGAEAALAAHGFLQGVMAR